MWPWIMWYGAVSCEIRPSPLFEMSPWPFIVMNSSPRLSPLNISSAPSPVFIASLIAAFKLW